MDLKVLLVLISFSTETNDHLLRAKRKRIAEEVDTHKVQQEAG